MKKILSLFLALFMGLSLAACGSNKDAEEAQQTVTDYLDAMKAGDYAKADDLCADSYSSNNLSETMKDITGIYKDAGVSEENIDKLQQALNALFSRCFESYGEPKTTIKDKDATVELDIEGISEASVENVIDDTFSSSFITDWSDENATDIENYAKEHDEQELLSYMYNKIVPTLCTNLEESLKKQTTETTTYVFELEKVTDKNDSGQEVSSWKITSVEPKEDAESDAKTPEEADNAEAADDKKDDAKADTKDDKADSDKD